MEAHPSLRTKTGPEETPDPVAKQIAYDSDGIRH